MRAVGTMEKIQLHKSIGGLSGCVSEGIPKYIYIHGFILLFFSIMSVWLLHNK